MPIALWSQDADLRPGRKALDPGQRAKKIEKMTQSIVSQGEAETLA
jgi:hypothetical protein